MIKFTLRKKFILIFAGIASIPFFIAMLITIDRLYRIQREDILENAQSIAESALKEIEAFVHTKFAVLEDVLVMYPEFSLDPQLHEALIERILFSHKEFVDLAVVDLDGKETVRRSAFLRITPEDLIDRSNSIEFYTIQKDGRYLGPVYLSNGRPLFVIGEAIFDANDIFQGGVFAIADARFLQDTVKEISATKQKGRAYIVNQIGVVIAHPDISYVLAESDFSAIPIVKSLIKKRDVFQVTDVYTNESNQEVLGAGIPVVFTFDERKETAINPQWFIVVERPAAFALATIQYLLRFSITILLVILVISLGIALLFANHIIDPIVQLHQTVLEFGRGNFDVRAKVATHDEVQDLADGFNNMAQNLQKSIVALSGEKNKLSTVLSGITDTVIAVDLKHRIILFNTAAEQLSGFQTKEVMGKPIDEMIKIFDMNGELPLKKYCPVGGDSREGIVFSQKGVKVAGSRNREAFGDLIVGQIREGASNGLGCILTLHDVTREQRIEKVKADFISITAHQLRTPLSGIKWSLKMLLEGDLGRVSSKQKMLLSKTYTTNERMIGLVRDLLDVVKIEEGYFGYQFATGYLEPLIEDIVETFQPIAEEKKVELIYIYPKGSPVPLMLDEERIRFASQALIENSIFYTAAKGKVVVSLHYSQDGVEMRIEDTGVGIPEDEQSRLFTKFFRGSNVVRMATEGSGLGLFIAKNIIEAHGGRMWFESKIGEGTTFHFFLPFQSPSRIATQ